MDNLLSNGKTGEVSAAFTILPSQIATLALRGDDTGNIASNAVVFIDIKDDKGDFMPLSKLSLYHRMLHLDYEGTYRVRRLAGPNVGVFYKISKKQEEITEGDGSTNSNTQGVTAQDLTNAGLLTSAKFDAANLMTSTDFWQADLLDHTRFKVETDKLATAAKQPTLINGRIPIDGSAITQPISAISLPLPTGAATAELQAELKVSVASIDSKVNASNIALTDTNTKLSTIISNTSGLNANLLNIKSVVDTNHTELVNSNTWLLNIQTAIVNQKQGTLATALKPNRIEGSINQISTDLNGAVRVILQDQNGDFTTLGIATIVPSSNSNVSVLPDATEIASASKILKTSAGNLFSVNVCTQGTAGYFMILDSSSVPSAGTVAPKKVIPLGPNQGLDTSWNVPLRFNNGIVLVFSSTGPFVFTPSATAFLEGECK